MRLADAAIRSIVESMAFRASAAPYLLLDTDLRIRAANPSYEAATLQRSSDMAGEFMFDVFPDNPDTPEARSVDHLGRSFERALVHDAPNRMGLQRYDVRDPGTGAFVGKSWLPVNSPVHDADGRIVGVLHHVEDVTHLVVATALERHLLPSEPDAHGVGGGGDVVEALRRDAATRQVRARMLLDRSHRAIERVAQRIGDDEQP